MGRKDEAVATATITFAEGGEGGEVVALQGPLLSDMLRSPENLRLRCRFFYFICQITTEVSNIAARRNT